MAPAPATIAGLARDLAKRRLSAVELTEATIARIEHLNPGLNAFLSLNPHALEDARTADRRLSRRERAPLLGVPIAIKDLILGTDAPTTAGSRIFGTGLVSNHDAPVIRRLRRAGAVIIGRTNLHELALGVTNLNEHFGPARNPRDPTRIPGGSSGGSAVAVAAGMVPAAVGTDTRGSIRIPAACCGVTGLKPTYGLVPTEDVIPLSWSLDHVGPITRTVEDAALLLGVMVGGKTGRRYLTAVKRPIKRLTIGVCDYFLRDVEPEIERAVRAAIRVFRDAGCVVRAAWMPELDISHSASAAITLAEAVSYHDRALKERPEGFGPAVRQRLEAGYRLTAVDLVKAQRQRAEVVRAFGRVFRDVDCIVGATLPAFPTPIGTDSLDLRGRETTVLAEFPRLTCPANLAGVPALTIPCGVGATGLPIGLQLMAAQRKEEIVLALGAAYQRHTA